MPDRAGLVSLHISNLTPNTRGLPGEGGMGALGFDMIDYHEEQLKNLDSFPEPLLINFVKEVIRFNIR